MLFQKRFVYFVNSKSANFAAVLVETLDIVPVKPIISAETTVGIDLEIKDFAITSNGEIFSNPKNLKNLSLSSNSFNVNFQNIKDKEQRKNLPYCTKK